MSLHYRPIENLKLIVNTYACNEWHPVNLSNMVLGTYCMQLSKTYDEHKSFVEISNVIQTYRLVAFSVRTTFS